MGAPVMERLLLRAGLRPTRKRLQLARILFDGPDKHVTAEQVMQATRDSGPTISLATVYNTLNQLAAAGLLRRISLDGSRTFFDTNTSEHHHIYYEEDDRLVDLPGDRLQISGLPVPARGAKVKSVEVLIRMHSDPQSDQT